MKRWAALLLAILFTGHCIKHYLQYLEIHQKEHEAAKLFLEQSPCQNSDIKARLGSFNLCEDAEARLGYSPHVHVVFDILTDLSICGRGRCHHMLQWITSNALLIAVSFFITAFILYKVHVDNQRYNILMKYQLPIQSRLYHEHQD